VEKLPVKAAIEYNIGKMLVYLNLINNLALSQRGALIITG